MCNKKNGLVDEFYGKLNNISMSTTLHLQATCLENQYALRTIRMIELVDYLKKARLSYVKASQNSKDKKQSATF